MNEDFYTILGVSKDASVDEIKKAYRKLAIANHPDKHPGDKVAEEKFKKINEAYETLSNTDKRAQYDAMRNGGGGAHFQQNFNGNGFNPFDMFNDFFKNSGFQSNFSSANFHEYPEEPAEDLNISLRIKVSFKEAYSGCKKDISFKIFEKCEKCNGSGKDKNSKYVKCRRCDGSGFVFTTEHRIFGRPTQRKVICKDCGGTGSHPEGLCKECHGAGKNEKIKHITINIPTGAFNGMQLRVSGMGNASNISNKVGDLFIIIDTPMFSEDGLFQRCDQFNISTVMNVSYYELMTGCEKNILLPNGIAKTFKIPENCAPGTVLKLKNCGFKLLSGNLSSSSSSGDLLLKINLKKISHLTDKQKELLKQFDDSLKK